MNKLRHAHPNVQNWLKNLHANDWDNIYQKYKDNLGCPDLESKQEELHWLLGYAIQQETHKNSKYFQIFGIFKYYCIYYFFFRTSVLKTCS